MPAGRPTAYTPEKAEIARAACLLGATNHDLAERFDVSRTTIDNWIATSPEFAAAVKAGREAADEAVVAALFDRAVGLEHKATKVFCHKGEPVIAEYVQHLPPDLRACMFWLRNRRPDTWREKKQPAAHVFDWNEEDRAHKAWKREQLAELAASAWRGAEAALPKGTGPDDSEPDEALASAAARLRLQS